jgi:hypothetical protein
MAVTFKLVEACSGTGTVVRGGTDVPGTVRYRINRYQGMMNGSGMPIPGLHRLEGSIEPEQGPLASELIGADVTLRLEDGRTIRLVVTDGKGSVLAEGHGPGRGCSCC